VRVFISWSGAWSKRLALALRDWLPLTVQAVEPYMSAEDIDKGARWSSDLAEELEVCNFGILCLTPENLEAAWIHFEAGALSKAVDRARVSPLLLGLRPSQVTGPLVQFQATEINYSEILALVKAINEACGEARIDPHRLERVFDAMWPPFENQVTTILTDMVAVQGTPPLRDTRALLEELLELARSQSRSLTLLEHWRHDDTPMTIITKRGVGGSFSGPEYEQHVLSVLKAEFLGVTEGLIGTQTFDFVLDTPTGQLPVEVKRRLTSSNVRLLIDRSAKLDAEATSTREMIVVAGEVSNSIDSGFRLGERPVHVIQWLPDDGPELLRNEFARLGAITRRVQG
jgi:hypothetical protein